MTSSSQHNQRALRQLQSQLREMVQTEVSDRISSAFDTALNSSKSKDVASGWGVSSAPPVDGSGQPPGAVSGAGVKGATTEDVAAMKRSEYGLSDGKAVKGGLMDLIAQQGVKNGSVHLTNSKVDDETAQVVNEKLSEMFT